VLLQRLPRDAHDSTIRQYTHGLLLESPFVPSSIYWLLGCTVKNKAKTAVWVAVEAKPEVEIWLRPKKIERALTTSYRPSIVTFPLSERVSEILPFLCFSTSLFPTPPLVSTKFLHVPTGVGGWTFGYEERRWVELIVRAISFQYFPLIWSWSTNVTDGQTDRQTDRETTSDSKTALCTIVHRAVEIQDLVDASGPACHCFTLSRPSCCICSGTLCVVNSQRSWVDGWLHLPCPR